jgi:hypothetical protein
VDVFRNQRAGGRPLPTFFGNLAGVANQGVRATATAEVLFGDSTNCVKPFAIPDKWQELRNNQGPPGWDPTDSFERYQQNGNGRGSLLNPADYYQAPSGGVNGTGFTRQSAGLGGDDYGLEIVLKFRQGNNQVSPGWFQPVVLTPGRPGDAEYRNNIATCNPTVIGPGTVLAVEPGAGVGPTRQGIADLIAQDPGASWDTSMNGGRGGIRGGCMAAGTCTTSPRLVAVPLYNPDIFNAGTPNGRTDITVVKVLGFFMVGMQGNDVVGRLMTYPSAPRGGTSSTPGAAFVVSIALVR